MDYKLVFFVALMVASAMSVPRGPSCPCPKIYMPVCAMVSNRKTTFNSMCEYQCEQNFVLHNGGTMELLYTGSRSSASQANRDIAALMHRAILIFVVVAFVATEAKAPTWTGVDCVCTTEYDPVCGSDMVRYSNYCVFKCRLQYLKEKGLPPIYQVPCYDLPPLFG
uniref:SFRICE_028123 n=1 Tax=Spodoptera frugiperda TaxID=7108 RepID=A0A2H1WBR4_SPOFR